MSAAILLALLTTLLPWTLTATSIVVFAVAPYALIAVRSGAPLESAPRALSVLGFLSTSQGLLGSCAAIYNALTSDIDPSEPQMVQELIGRICFAPASTIAGLIPAAVALSVVKLLPEASSPGQKEDHHG